MTYTVYLQKHTDYADRARLKEIFLEGLRRTSKASFHGKTVLIKPNFLKYAPPEKAVITHPLFLKALMELLKDMGAKIFIGDSPGLGTLEGVINKSGLMPFLNRLGVNIADFSKTSVIKTKNPLLFREFELPNILFDVDEIINVPKLKTHQMMVLTLAVKNLYGCIPGLKKVKFHLTAGHDYDTFASLLLDLYGIINPGINILDGILGMEGDGPSAGIVRKFEIIAVGNNALALDAALSKILGVNPGKVPYLGVARKHNFSEINADCLSEQSEAAGNLSQTRSLRSFMPFRVSGSFQSPFTPQRALDGGFTRSHSPSELSLKRKTQLPRLMTVCSRHPAASFYEETGISENNIIFSGMPAHQFSIAPIKLPKSYRSDFAVPPFLKRFAKSFLFSYPYVISTCKSCGVCKKHCPASAVEMKKRAVIDKAKCIRCYCCQELCEHNAIKVKRGMWRAT